MRVVKKRKGTAEAVPAALVTPCLLKDDRATSLEVDDGNANAHAPIFQSGSGSMHGRIPSLLYVDNQ
jgi:hypothetical protein